MRAGKSILGTLFDIPKKSDDVRALKSITHAKPKDPLKAVSDKVLSALGQYEKEYALIENSDDLRKWAERAIKDGVCGIDTETMGLDVFKDPIVGFSLYSPSNRAIYVPLNHRSYYTKQRLDENANIDDCAQILRDMVSAGVKFIFHNGKFDYEILWNNLHVKVPPYWDTLVMAHLLEQDEQHGLKYLWHKYCRKSDAPIFKFGDLFETMNFADVPPKVGFIYAAHDARMTYDLYKWQDVKTSSGEYSRLRHNIFEKMEMPLVTDIAKMELYGCAIDLDYAKKLHDDYTREVDKAQAQYIVELNNKRDVIDAYRKAHPGELSDPVNNLSPKELATLFYDCLKLPSPDGTRGTGIKNLQALNNPIGNAVLEVRKWQKLLSTYIDAIPAKIAPDGRLHGSYSQFGTDTGRFSSSDPNLQNIPSHDHNIRKMFVATKGYALIGFDYSQQEPHVLAFLSRDPGLVNAYRAGKDVYAEISSMVYKKPYEQCLEFNKDGTTNWEAKARRAKCKVLVLGLSYGMGVNMLAQRMGVDKDEAQGILDEFFKMFPNVKKFTEEVNQFVHVHGYAETILGRRRNIPDMMLDDYVLTPTDKFHPHVATEFDPLDFTDPRMTALKPYYDSLHNARSRFAREGALEACRRAGINVVDNDEAISSAKRKCVNSVIQGSAADMSKIAVLLCMSDPIMRECDFHPLFLVHDEIIGECLDAKKWVAYDRLKWCMLEAARRVLGDFPMKGDQTISYKWTGDEIKRDITHKEE